jgi:hypothetical protein
MENEIRRGDYVKFGYYGDIGLVRRVKYVGRISGPVAEVIFDRATYIAEVPIDLLLSIGACKSGSIPEPGMYFQTCIGAWKCAKYINFVRNTQTGVCYRIATDDTTYYGPFKEETFTYGAPRIMRFFDSRVVPKHHTTYYIDTDIAFAISIMHNMRKDENTMNPIEKVIFNGPATIVFWKDGTKTVVKYQDVDTPDPEKGLAMAIAKHYLCDICGLARYDGIFKKYLPKETKEK